MREQVSSNGGLKTRQSACTCYVGTASGSSFCVMLKITVCHKRDNWPASYGSKNMFVLNNQG